MEIGFIGCGKIAEPMIRSLYRRFPDCGIFVSRRGESTSARLSEELVNVRAGDNQWVLDQSRVVFLCVLADIARNQLPGLQFRKDHQVISVMTDIDLAEISKLISPAKSPCVTIPLPFIETGGCPLPVFPQSAVFERLFSDENEIITLSRESAIGPHFAATAILSTLMAYLDCTSKWLGRKSGNSTDGEIYVSTLVSGYLDSLKKDGNQRFLEAINELTTEGGLNYQLLGHNKDAGMLDTLEAGLEALDRRLNGAG